MVFVVQELIDMIVMVAITGYVFSGIFERMHPAHYDPLHLSSPRFFRMRSFLFSCAVVGPSILLHELGHKFFALGFGLQATFHAFYTMLGLGVILKLFSAPFLVIAPAYVSISGQATAPQQALISFAGPMVHLIFWGIAFAALKQQDLSHRTIKFWHAMKEINMLLFIFNMLPIPGFDGFGVFGNLFKIF